VSVEHLARSDFDRARWKHVWRQVGSWMTGRSNELLSFDEVRKRLHAQGQRERGLRTVPIDRIVGSVGRYRDFDRAFLPSQAQTRTRWVNIDRAHHEYVTLPPIELYKVGETYFVKDGNHRVSVASERGQEFIDAYVTEIQTPAVIQSFDDLVACLEREEIVDFLEKTQLSALRPRHDQIKLTLPGQYEKLLEHIEGHRWFRGIEEKREIPWSEAVISWYDHVYAPLVEIIRSSNVLDEFPHRTEADLYLWIIEHEWYLRQAGELEADSPTEEVAREFAQEYSERPTRRLARAARHRARVLARRLSRARPLGRGSSSAENEAPVDSRAEGEVPATSTHQGQLAPERDSGRTATDADA
jgi:hypothetical protein